MKDIEDLVLGWHHWNNTFFSGELKGPPRFEIDDRITAHALYDRCRRTIVLNRGFKRHFLSGPLVSEMAAHTILYEMAHAWVHDMHKSDSNPHGPWFAFIANRVAPLLGA